MPEHEMTPGQWRAIKAAERLTKAGSLTYDMPRGDDTPIPTCVGCNASSWGEIKHYSGCQVQELIAAVRALSSAEQQPTSG